MGGTSVASPAMAGIMALINQKAGAAQGSPNTLLCKLASQQAYSACSTEKVKAGSTCLFSDIDTGTNAMPCVNDSPGCTALSSGDPAGILNGYSAGTGYDLATGLGSLNAANVVNRWPLETAPGVSLLPGSLAFSPTVEGTLAATQAVILKNTGKTALTLSGTGLGITISGANSRSFTQTNTCGSSVAAGASCAITVTFKPASTGKLTATVNFADNALGSPQTVALSETGTAATPAVTLSATSISFSTTTVGNTGANSTFALKNTGSGPLTLTRVTLSGANASSFSQSNTCGSTVAATATCTITVCFKPAAAGALTAAVTFTDNAAGSPQSVALSGGGTTVALSSNFEFFATTKVGSSETPVHITLTNKESAALSVTGMSITGTNASSFSQTNTCGKSVAPAANCTITLTFKPAITGALTATLNIADSAYGTPDQPELFVVFLDRGAVSVCLSLKIP